MDRKLISEIFNREASGAFAQWIETLFPAQGGAPLNVALLVLNTILVSVAIYLLMTQVIAAIAHIAQAKFAGKSIWERLSLTGFIRSLVVIGFLTPGPNGYAAYNTIISAVAVAGSNLAQVTWDRIIEDLYTYDYEPTPLPDPHVETLAHDLWVSAACAAYTGLSQNRPENATYYFQEDFAVTFHGLKNRENIYPVEAQCGRFRASAKAEDLYALIDKLNRKWSSYDFTDNTTTILNQAAEAYHTVYHTALKQYVSIITEEAKAFALYAYPPTATENTWNSSQLHAATTQFVDRQKRARDTFRVAVAQIVNSNEQYAYSTPWHRAASYYQRIATLETTIAAAVEQSRGHYSAPSWDTIWPEPTPSQTRFKNSINADTAETKHFGRIPVAVRTTNAPLSSPSATGVPRAILAALHEILTPFESAYQTAQDKSNQFLATIDRGYILQGIAAVLFSATLFLDSVDSISAFISSLDSFKSLITTTYITLGIVGFTLSDIIPLLPALMTLYAVSQWLFNTVLTFSTLGISLAFNVRLLASDLLLGDITALVAEVFLRPALILIGLIMGFYLFEIIAQQLYEMTSYALANLDMTSIGALLKWPLYSVMQAALLLLVAFFSFSLIYVIPNLVIARIPNGDHLGGVR